MIRKFIKTKRIVIPSASEESGLSRNPSLDRRLPAHMFREIPRCVRNDKIYLGMTRFIKITFLFSTVNSTVNNRLLDRYRIIRQLTRPAPPLVHEPFTFSHIEWA